MGTIKAIDLAVFLVFIVLPLTCAQTVHPSERARSTEARRLLQGLVVSNAKYLNCKELTTK
jgi:hypothetical protein